MFKYLWNQLRTFLTKNLKIPSVTTENAIQIYFFTPKKIMVFGICQKIFFTILM